MDLNCRASLGKKNVSELNGLNSKQSDYIHLNNTKEHSIEMNKKDSIGSM